MPINQATSTTFCSSHKPWKMVAMGVLEVTESSRNNRYLLEVQDYFTRGADAVPLQDQTANRIPEELAKVSVTYGQPEIFHSDRNQNAELHCPSDLRCIWHRQFVAHHILSPTRRRFNGVVQQVTPADVLSIR